MNATICPHHMELIRAVDFGFLPEAWREPDGRVHVIFHCWNKIACAECGEIELVKYDLPAIIEADPVPSPRSRGEGQGEGPA